MRKCLLVLGVLILGSMLHAAPPDAPSGWRAKVAETMPSLGHRNWILIVDSAYPLQASATESRPSKPTHRNRRLFATFLQPSTAPSTFGL